MFCKPDVRLVYCLALVYRVLWGNIWIRAALVWAAILACLFGIFFSTRG